MAIFREKPYASMNFLVDIGTGSDGPQDGVSEVIFPEARVHVIQYRNGNEKMNEPRKTMSFTYYGNLILKRGAIGNLNWYEWWDQIRGGMIDNTRTVLVQLCSEDHSSVVLSWRFLNARPVNHQFSPLNALCSDPLIETLELAFERLEID